MKRVFKRKRFFLRSTFQYDYFLFFFLLFWITSKIKNSIFLEFVENVCNKMNNWICSINISCQFKYTFKINVIFGMLNDLILDEHLSLQFNSNLSQLYVFSFIFFFFISFHVLCSCTLVCVHMHSIVLEKKKYAPHTRVATLVNNSRTCRSTIVHVTVSTFCF